MLTLFKIRYIGSSLVEYDVITEILASIREEVDSLLGKSTARIAGIMKKKSYVELCSDVKFTI